MHVIQEHALIAPAGMNVDAEHAHPKAGNNFIAQQESSAACAQEGCGTYWICVNCFCQLDQAKILSLCPELQQVSPVGAVGWIIECAILYDR